MKVVKPEIRIVFYVPENGQTSEQGIEEAGRTCYKSEDRITDESASKFVRMLRKRGHHAVLEFGYARALIIADRGLTHELVRHRLASFAQESTRFCDYSKGRFNSEITIIAQPGIEEGTQAHTRWVQAMEYIEKAYMDLIDMGVPSEIARSVLPIGLKAEINIGANLREWRHIFKMRCASAAHPMIRGVMLEALKQFYEKMPVIYEDLYEEFIPERPDKYKEIKELTDDDRDEIYKFAMKISKETMKGKDELLRQGEKVRC